jgi:hypothetical protein
MQFSAAAVTGGVRHMSRGASNNLIEFKFEKIALLRFLFTTH